MKRDTSTTPHLTIWRFFQTFTAGLLVTGSAIAYAADTPATIVVPFPPGGTTDLLARALSQPLAERLDRTVIVDNKPGAGGSLGSRIVAKSEPNGETLSMATAGTLTINPHIYKTLPYDSESAFAPVSRVGTVANVLVVN